MVPHCTVIEPGVRPSARAYPGGFCETSARKSARKQAIMQVPRLISSHQGLNTYVIFLILSQTKLSLQEKWAGWEPSGGTHQSVLVSSGKIWRLSIPCWQSLQIVNATLDKIFERRHCMHWNFSSLNAKTDKIWNWMWSYAFLLFNSKGDSVPGANHHPSHPRTTINFHCIHFEIGYC